MHWDKSTENSEVDNMLVQLQLQHRMYHPSRLREQLPAADITNALPYLKNWCRTVLQFLIEKFGKSQGLAVFLEVVEEQRNTAHFKSIENDLLEWVRVLSAVDFVQLDLLLIREFGTGFYEKLQTSACDIDAIKQRGKIINQEEYILVLSYIDENSQFATSNITSPVDLLVEAGANKGELNTLYKLLLTFK